MKPVSQDPKPKIKIVNKPTAAGGGKTREDTDRNPMPRPRCGGGANDV